MIKSASAELRRKRRDVYSSWIFLIIGLSLLLFSLTSWLVEIKPRLKSEAISNLQILGDSKARLIEGYIDDLETRDNLEAIFDTFNELLLLIDPFTQQRIFEGIELELDFTLPSSVSINQRIQAGELNCLNCIKSESPVYSRKTGELIAILKIYANPWLYKQLVYDVGMRIAIVVMALMLVVLLAWIMSRRLLQGLVQREINLQKEIGERKQAEQRLHQIAAYDQLTNLPNRYLLNTEFSNKLEEARRNGNQLAVLFFDLDDFKNINDIFGHETGDLLLKEVAERISGNIRRYDLFSRFGGDEFVMIMPFLNDHSEIYILLEKIIASFSDEFRLANNPVKVTTSIGVSIYPNDGSTPDKLLKNADLAMYRAKADGRNRYHFFTSKMNEELRRARWIETHLKQAIINNELKLFFQPQMDLHSGEVTSCEALVRWPQKDGKTIYPDDFIAIAEKSGLINELTQWVLKSACQQQDEWQEQGFKGVRIDVNISSRDFSRNDVIDELQQYIQEDPQFISKIGIEITENVLLESTEEKKDLLNSLYSSGMHISIDDFGTGYSSMNYLRNFSVSGIKIDQTFVREAPKRAEDQTIIEAIVTLGHGLDLQVIAEGVESADHMTLARQVRCDLVQGYYIAGALSADDFRDQFLKPLPEK